jgi:hypothetical protein
MAVDLADLVPSLRAELGLPGTTAYPDATTGDLVIRLSNAFWEARLNGLFATYREEDGVIVPISGTEDLGRDFQQVLVLYAAYAVILNQFRNAQAQFHAKAGPVEYSTQTSVSILKDVLAAMRERLGAVIASISTYSSGAAYAIDAMVARTEAMYYGEIWWVK